MDKVYKNIGKAALVGGVLYLLGRSISKKIEISVDTPTFDYSGFYMSPPVLRLNLPITVKNNNPVAATVTGFEGSVFYGTTKLSDVNIPIPAQIPANGIGYISVNLDINALQVINDVINAINSGGLFSTLVNKIRLKGVLKTNVLNVPIDQVISIV
jgi:hypothetical protein